MRSKGFTLVELMISVLVLLIIIAATARIFSATSKISSLGEANADLQTISTSIERTIRRDIDRLSRDGFLLIQCVALRNDLYKSLVPTSTVLLDTSIAAKEYVRCDQIIFVARGSETTQSFEGSSSFYEYPVRRFTEPDITLAGEGVAYDQVIRLGHGIQYPQLVTNPKDTTARPDPDLFTYPGMPIKEGPPTPWMWQVPGSPQLKVKVFDLGGDATPKSGYVAPLDARHWSLSRQVALLADDGGDAATQRGPFFFRRSNISTSSTPVPVNSAAGLVQRGNGFPSQSDYGLGRATGITKFLKDAEIYPDHYLLSGRIDIAATSIPEFRNLIGNSDSWSLASGPSLPWSEFSQITPLDLDHAGQVRSRLLNAFFGAGLPLGTEFYFGGMWGWPRSEVISPSGDRLDLMTTASTMTGNCSSFKIDWTWSEGTGRVFAADATPQTADASPDRNMPTVVENVPLPGVMIEDWPNYPGTTSGGIKIDIAKASPHIPWFGLPDSIFPLSQRDGTTTLAGGLAASIAKPLSLATNTLGQKSYATPIMILDPSVTVEAEKAVAANLITIGVVAPPIDTERIEGHEGPGSGNSRTAIVRPFGSTIPVFVYQAAFGFNGSNPLVKNDRKQYTSTPSRRVLRSDYTPWPSALRFTYTLHDSKMVMGNGRTFQFIVKLSGEEKP